MTKRFLTGFWIGIVLLATGWTGWCVDDYLYRHFNTYHGLPQGTVRSIAQDSNGFLWIGTGSGVVRFDGDCFQPFFDNAGDPGAFPLGQDIRVNSLLMLPDKTVWCATERRGVSVYYCRRNRYRHLTVENGLPCNNVRSMDMDFHDSLWLGTWGGGLVHVSIRGNRFKLNVINRDGGLSDNRINKVLKGMGDRIWIATANGLTLLQGGTCYRFFQADGLPSSDTRSLYLDPDGILWIGTGAGLACIELSSGVWNVRNIPRSMRLSGLEVFDISQDRDGNIWVATSGGLFRFSRELKRGYSVTHIKPSVNIPGSASYQSLCLDRDGILWAGLLGHGLVNVRKGVFGTFTVKDGLSHPNVTSIYMDSGLILWAGTAGGGLNRIKKRRVTSFTTAHGLQSNHVTTLARDKAGKLWIGTDRGLNSFGIDQQRQISQNSRFDRHELVVPGKQKGTARPYIRVLYKDKSGTLWLGADNYGSELFLFRKESGHSDFSTIPVHKKYRRIQCIKTEGKRVWAGTAAGLLCIDKLSNRPLAFNLENKLEHYDIRDIHMDEEGYIWLGTVGAGLLCYDGRNLSTYSDPLEFRRTSIFRILEDSRGILWLSGKNGLFAVSRSMFPSTTSWKTRLMKSRFPPVYRHFQENDGLRSTVFASGSQPAGWKGADGRLWFPGADGITFFEPGDIDTSEPVLPVVIEKVVTDGREYLPGDALVFSSHVERMEIYCYAVNLTGMRNVSLTYKLRKDLTNYRKKNVSGNKIVLSGLDPGTYKLSIMAGKDRKTMTDDDIQFRFIIKHTISLGEGIVFIFVLVLVVLLLVISRSLSRHALLLMPARIFKEDARYKTSSLKPGKKRSHTKELIKIMEEEKPFLDPEMSVAKMAERLNVPKEYVSQIVNQRFRLNFNQFLNKYRVEEARKKLLDPKESGFVVLKIAYDVGFNSKSTFNNAFKKFTGMSPSQFRDAHAGNSKDGQ